MSFGRFPSIQHRLGDQGDAALGDAEPLAVLVGVLGLGSDWIGGSVLLSPEIHRIGLALALAFYLVGPLFTDYFLGAGYAELNTLWLAFACFTAARFVAAGLGVQLMAMGTGFLRTFGIIFSGVVTVTCYWVFIPRHGIQAAPWVSTLGMVVLTLIYGYAVQNIYRKRRAAA